MENDDKRLKEVLGKYYPEDVQRIENEEKEEKRQRIMKGTGMVKTFFIKLFKFVYHVVSPIFFCALFVYIAFNFGTIHVSGTSMEPTYINNDLLITDKTIDTVKRGDVVIVDSNKYINKGLIIKRAIAVEGDTIAVRKGRTYLNGEELKEPYARLMDNSDMDVPQMKIPKGQVFVMGDNRAVSLDSRAFGPVAKGDIKSIVCYDGSLIKSAGQFVYGQLLSK